MDKPEDSQKSKPPGDAPKTYMSPKLRGKMNLDDDDDDGEGSGQNVQNIVAIVMVVVIAGLGFLLYNGMQKSKVEAKAAAAQAAKLARDQAVKDSLEKAASDSLYKAQQDSVAAYQAKHPKPKQPAATAAAATPGAAPGATAASAAPATPAPPPAKFGIDVGTFLNQDKANSEQTRLQTATGLTAKVEPTSDGGVTSYRIVLGDFPSRAAAEKKANELIVAQSIREAHVIKLKAGS